MQNHDPQRQTRLVTCPKCKGESLYAQSNPYRPFCSQRCKDVDFGAWASQEFRVPADDQPPDAHSGESQLQ